MEKLNGYKTYIVFGVLLINAIVGLLGWDNVQLPADLQEYQDLFLIVLAFVMRKLTNGKPAL